MKIYFLNSVAYLFFLCDVCFVFESVMLHVSREFDRCDSKRKW